MLLLYTAYVMMAEVSVLASSSVQEAITSLLAMASGELVNNMRMC